MNILKSALIHLKAKNGLDSAAVLEHSTLLATRKRFDAFVNIIFTK
jgi:hypothetical protein